MKRIAGGGGIAGAGVKGFRLRRLAADPNGSGDGAIAPDGTRFVASSKRNGSVNLWFFDLSSGKWQQGTWGTGDDIEAQWSPDGRQLTFTSSRGGHKAIWLYRLSDGQVRQLTSADHEEEYPSWSPDGSTVAFVGGSWGRRHFLVVPATGGTPRPVTTNPGRAGACSWAPDGRWLVCHSYDTGAGAVWLLDSQTAEAIQVTDGSSWDYKPTICPTRPAVAFSRSNEGRSVIWVQRLGDGTGGPLVVTGADDRWPTWTRDGNHLFFHRLVDEGAGIAVWDRRTRVVRDLVPAEHKPRYASFAPDGRRIVYGTEAGGRSRLRILNLDTGTSQPLPAGEAAFPTWSPDGRTIACTVRPDPSSRWEIATVDVSSGQVQLWTTGRTDLRGLHAPVSFAPDGRRLVFRSETEPFEANLLVLDLNSGRFTNLTEDSWWDEAPSFSPDGRSVIFMSTRGGDWTWGFYRIDLDSKEIVTVAGPDYIERNNPQLTVDGRVLSTMVASKVEELYEQLPDGAGRVVTEAGPAVRYPVPSADGEQVVFTRTRTTVEYWLAENVWAADSPLAPLARPLVAEAGTPQVIDQPPLGPVRSPVDTRRR
ncbi:peptidase S9B, dipeptidylpeptidase IV domain protein [Salinispora tropica CNB-440]|uniref:Peptidase S9B, dipeptidylpeptidase IV domain protein n=1 Tax=Salinispora tropica (strain ATCC BAA-916 / DSM 44818 / JCM 13857 / NBRC 105044 / CNB-440) TaxID=369723 RepID=A4X2H0_SALTO|nr:peptidase S9B, dipeptidylpeptidase IV domain protein [Salinispora tropica CNB-440]